MDAAAELKAIKEAIVSLRGDVAAASTEVSAMKTWLSAHLIAGTAIIFAAGCLVGFVFGRI